MLAAQRHNKIIERLSSRGSGRVSELAEVFNVTEETIRRDLEKLDREGRLVRIHGGAVAVADQTRDTPFDVRRSANHGAKERIAQKALRWVTEGLAIGLDASSTAHELACRLPDVPLTVVTNAFGATAELWGRKQIRVLTTGGMLDSPSRSWVGSFAEEALDRVNLSTLFLSTKGVDLDRGLSEVDDEHARIKHRMIERAERVVLLVDHSKFGIRSAVSFASLDQVHVVITDSRTDQGILDQMREMGIEVEVAE